MDYSKVFVPIDVSRDEIIKELIEQRNILQAKYDNMTVFANNLNDEVLKLQAKLDEDHKASFKLLEDYRIAEGELRRRLDIAVEALKYAAHYVNGNVVIEALAKLESK